MKIMVVGMGQCGCNIADEFYGINNYAKSFFGRRMEILIDAFAVNTDDADLASVRHIPRDKRHRILIGLAKTFGHGVGKMNVEGATIMSEAYPVIVENLITSSKFHESDGIVVVASGAGGTGSGGIGWLIKGLKERMEKPVYAIIVMPFAYEEKGEHSYAVINTARCLKTVNQYADAVFLLDNERFAKAGVGISTNLHEINQQIVKNFYDLFCAGEEYRHQYIGSKVIDAGDIKQTLGGICTIGRGEVPLSTFYGRNKTDYREAAKESVGAIGALGKAINSLTLKANIEDAARILVLISAPKDVTTLSVLSEISNSVQEKSPKAVLRIGDYPRRGKEISVSIILSQLTAVARMEGLFLQAELLLKNQEKIEEETAQKVKLMHQTSSNIPPLA